MRRNRRGMALAAAVALVATTAVYLNNGSTVGAETSSTTLSCSPSDPAVRKAISDQAGLLSGLAAGLDLNTLSLPSSIETSVPGSLTPGQGGVLSFSWSVQIPVNLVNLLTRLEVKSIDVTSISLPVQATSKGNVLTTVAGTRPDANFALTADQAVTVTGGPFTGALANVPGGQITYASTGGGFTVKGVLTGALAATARSTLPSLFPAGDNQIVLPMSCTTPVFASTLVQVPGAPIITKVPGNSVQQNQTATVNVGQYITPGVADGKPNPVIPGSLKLTGNSAGFALNGNNITFTGAPTAGQRTATFEVCAAETESVAAVQAVNEVQTMTMKKDFSYKEDPNFFNDLDKPIYFTLRINGKETPAIQTTRLRFNELPFVDPSTGDQTINLLAQPILSAGGPISRLGTYDMLREVPLSSTYGTDGKRAPIPQGDRDNAALITLAQIWATNRYEPPTAAEIQAAVDAAVGPGNVTVTQNAPAANGLPGWSFTYTGTLAGTDVPNVEIGQWVTFPPYHVFEGLLGLINRPSGGDGPALPSLDDWNKFWRDLIKAPPAEEAFSVLLYEEVIKGLVDFSKGSLGETPNELVQRILSWFPPKPEIATPTSGVAFAAAKLSGPLCTEGTWTVTVNAAEVQGATETRTAARTPVVVAGVRQQWTG